MEEQMMRGDSCMMKRPRARCAVAGAAAAALTFETERSSDCVNVCDAVAPRRRVSKVNLLLLATAFDEISYGGARARGASRGGGASAVRRPSSHAARDRVSYDTTILGSDYNH